jgi:hypothetical protein
MPYRHLVDAARDVVVAAVAATLLFSTRAAAQTQSQVSVTGGLATDQRGVRSTALIVAPSVLLVAQPATTLAFDANFTRFDDEGLSIGGGAALNHRDQFAGSLALTLDASTSASRLNVQRTSASFLTGELVPALELGIYGVSLFGGARVAGGRIWQNEQRRIVPPRGGGTTTTSVSQGRSGVGPTFGVNIVTMGFPQRVVRFGAREDRLIVSGVTIRDRTATGSIVGAKSTLRGSFGERVATDERGLFGDVGFDVAIVNGMELNTGAGWYPSDRLTGAMSGSWYSAGFSFQFAGARMQGRREP